MDAEMVQKGAETKAADLIRKTAESDRKDSDAVKVKKDARAKVDHMNKQVRTAESVDDIA